MKKKKEAKKKKPCCERVKQYSKKEIDKLSLYAEAVILLAVVGFVISIALKLLFSHIAPTEINSLTAYRFSTFLILLGIALLFYKQKG